MDKPVAEGDVLWRAYLVLDEALKASSREKDVQVLKRAIARLRWASPERKKGK